MRTTVHDIASCKQSGERIVMLTAYDHPSAAIAQAAGVRFLLVGDSLGMVVLGRDSTLPVTLDDIARHAEAVVRGAPSALVVADLPFLTYASPADAVAAARRLLGQAGAQAVKLEGGAAVADTVRHLTTLGVPVMGHLGFTPQAMHQVGVRVQAKQAAEARQLIDDALALQDAGAFAVVLELVPAPLAEAVTRRLRIPTIGIGAGAGCDGQVQVWHDVLGLGTGKPPRHAKVYAALGEAMRVAIEAYAGEVRAGTFPTAANSAKMDPAELERALGDGEAE